MNKKIYIVIIIILLLIIGFLGYNQFSNKKQDNTNNIDYGDLGKVFKGDLIIGNEKAPITIIEYYSYLCGHCKVFEDETLPKLSEEYIVTGKVKLILRPFPPYELAQAVLCANDQDKFLEYHNYLFANNDKINSIDILKTFAENIGMNKKKFDDCLSSEKYKSRAEELYNQGNGDFKKAGIPDAQQGTPTFFINGETIIGAMPYSDFVKVIESKLSN
jgi:protein-disulfide isomerase